MSFTTRLRKIHVAIASLVLIPSSIIFSTGLVLQLKDLVPGLKPPLPKISLTRSTVPLMTITQIYDRVVSLDGSQINGWNDIQTIEYLPSNNVYRVRTKNYYEYYFHPFQGQLLSHGKRYSSLLISIHEGKYFGELTKNSVFILSGLFINLLLVSGFLLMYKFWRNLFALKTRNLANAS